MKIGIILQARMSSTRRPFKIASLVLGKPILFHQIKRIKKFSKSKIPLIVATTENIADDSTVFIAESAGAKVYRGSETDVMKRYIEAAKAFKLDGIIRVCGDDPLVDPKCLSTLYKTAEKDKSIEYITASHKKGWMLGTSAEYFTLKAIKRAYSNSSEFEKEHVVLKFVRNEGDYKTTKVENDSSKHPFSLTVDHPDELESVKNVIEYFKGVNFSQEQLVSALTAKKIKLKHKPQFFNY